MYESEFDFEDKVDILLDDYDGVEDFDFVIDYEDESGSIKLSYDDSLDEMYGDLVLEIVQELEIEQPRIFSHYNETDNTYFAIIKGRKDKWNK